MTKKSFPILGFIALLFLLAQNAFSQNVSVDNFTGTPNVSIPFFSLKSGSVTLPIGINYNSRGVKVKQAEGDAGMGWNLMAGGQISRQVRGLPDDAKLDESSNARLGWLYNTNGTTINSLTLYNDNNQGTCTDENTDMTSLGSFSSLSDTEPDIFYVNAPGLSCKLVFDKDQNIHTIPYQDIKVSYELETSVSPSFTSYGRIKKFAITTSSGFTYTFDKLELTGQITTSSSPGSIAFYNREYGQYEHALLYVSTWKITSVVDQGGNGFWFTYTESDDMAGQTRLGLYLGTGTIPTYPFTYITSTKQQVLTSIFPTSDDVPWATFYYSNAPTSHAALLDSVVGVKRKVNLAYNNVSTNNNNSAKKSFLAAVTDLNNSVHAQYTFDYQSLDNFYGKVNLPDSTTNKIDAWGYYNASSETTLLPYIYINPSNSSYEQLRNENPGSGAGSYTYTVPGAYRLVNADSVANGTLSKINYQEGGSTTITYEPNEYYDPTADAASYGGGVRVKEITDYDGIDAGKNITRSYSYIDPSTSKTSGKAVSVPVLAFTTPYATPGTDEDQWQQSIVRLTENISQEENAVIYSHVKVSQSGIGYSMYEYATPATYWDSSASPDWTPTISNVGRPGCGFGGYLSNTKNTFPFAPNTNFDFERGLLKKVTQYNNSGDKETESAYTYTRTGSPYVISALKFDNNNGITAYAKYSILASVGELSSQVNTKIFDAPSTTQYNESTVDYTYAGTDHKLPTLVTQTNSDGTISRNYSKYVKDYNVSTHSDDQTTAIYNLQQLGFNMPIETYSQLERSSVNRTIAASLIKLKPWSFSPRPTLYLPAQQLSFLDASGVTNFAASTVTSGAFVNDSRYVVKGNMTAYDSYGYLQTSNDNNKNVQTVLTNQFTSGPVAAFGNASVEEIAFDDFDSFTLNTGFANNLTGTLNINSRSGRHSMSITSSNYFTRSITKNADAKSYIFSIWANTSSTGTLTLSLTNASSSTYTYTISVANTANKWKYYQLKVPVTNMSSTFTVKHESNISMLIDDVLFYPADATVSTQAYDMISLAKTSETNGNGQSQYYVYDKAFRLKQVLDNEKNIILKKTYVNASPNTYAADVADDGNFAVGISGQAYDNGWIDNKEGVTYTWDFGDGSTAVTNSNLSGFEPHVYASTGTYTISLTKTSPLYGTVTDTKNVVVDYPATPVALSASGGHAFNAVFSQGGVAVATFSSTSIPANISPGIYDVTIISADRYRVSNLTGYKCIRLQGFGPSFTGYYTYCQNSDPNTTTYTFYGVSFFTKVSLNIDLNDDECAPGEGGGGVERKANTKN